MMTNATAAVTATITNGQQRMADAIGKRLGATVTFLRWQPSPRAAGAESPIFAVPAESVRRAGEFGFDSWQFVAR